MMTCLATPECRAVCNYGTALTSWQSIQKPKLTANDTGTPDYSTVTHLPWKVVLSCLYTNATNATVAQMQSRLVFPYQTGRITM